MPNQNGVLWASGSVRRQLFQLENGVASVLSQESITIIPNDSRIARAP